MALKFIYIFSLLHTQCQIPQMLYILHNHDQWIEVKA